MSLIEKALRELPEPLTPTEQQQPVTKPAMPPQAPAVEQKPIHSWSTAAASTSAPPLAPRISATQVLAIAAILLFAVALVRSGRGWQARTSGPGTSALPAGILSPGTAAPAPASRSTGAGRGESVAKLALRTPTTPAQGQLVLNGIAEGVGAPYAMINGLVVGVGDRIGNFTLIEIARGAARLRETNGNETTLRVSH